MARFVYYGEFSQYSDCENWIAHALDRNGHLCVRLQRHRTLFNPNRLIHAIKNSNADYLLLTKTPEISAEQLRQVKIQTNVRIVFWTFDWMMHPTNAEWYLPLASLADYAFQTDGCNPALAYTVYGINRIELHQGIMPRVHNVPSDLTSAEIARFAADVSFIGSIYTKRRQVLRRELEQYDFKKWGEPDDQVWGREFAAVCYLSKIVAGDNFVNDVAGYWSDRVYLTLGCGGFFLTAYVEGLEREFENHKHLVWWHDFKEMRHWIEYYLPREAERKAIARAGYDLVHSRDTYDHRIQTMTRELNALGSDKR